MPEHATALAPATTPTHGFEFHGSGTEYFRIWIVNLFLSIVTLGIYSAWATVRNRRYLYGSTRIMGSAFDFHARGGQILKGRLVAVALVAIFMLLGQVLPLWQPALLLVLVPFMPWVIVQTRRFQTANTSWRGVRFGFDRAYWPAARVFLFWPLLLLPTLGWIYPYLFFRQQKFFVENTRFGREWFRFGGSPGYFYVLMIVVGCITVATVIAAIAMAVAAGMLWFDIQQSGQAPPIGFTIMVGLVPYAVMLIAANVFLTFVRNYVWNHVSIQNGAFTSRLGVWPMLGISLSNLLLIIVTVGLFTPFARVRMLRYCLSRLSLTMAEDDVARIAAGAEDKAGALGDEVAGAFDMDIGLA